MRDLDLHLHLPAGSVRKDGPSAGVALVLSMVSLLSGHALDPTLAMTGEITLRGKVTPVGGIKEKVLAAHRAGIRRVMLPLCVKVNFLTSQDAILIHWYSLPPQPEPQGHRCRSSEQSQRGYPSLVRRGYMAGTGDWVRGQALAPCASTAVQA